MFSEIEKQTMLTDMEHLLSSFGKAMTVFRSVGVNQGSFSGSILTSEVLVNQAAIEEKMLSPKSLTDGGADRMVCCGGQTDIREGDRVEIEGISFLVSHINPQNVFGVVTHLEVMLEQDRRNG